MEIETIIKHLTVKAIKTIAKEKDIYIPTIVDGVKLKKDDMKKLLIEGLEKINSSKPENKPDKNKDTKVKKVHVPNNMGLKGKAPVPIKEEIESTKVENKKKVVKPLKGYEVNDIVVNEYNSGNSRFFCFYKIVKITPTGSLRLESIEKNKEYIDKNIISKSKVSPMIINGIPIIPANKDKILVKKDTEYNSYQGYKPYNNKKNYIEIYYPM